MEQVALVDALGKQLDALSTLVNWAVGLALATIWAGAQRNEEVSLFSMKIARKDAFYVLAAAFLYVNVMAIVFFVRIGDIVATVDAKNLTKAVTVLGTNAWPFNPYAFFGSSLSALSVSNFGYGALIAIWWIGYTALAMCRDDQKSFGYRAVIVIFLLIGLVSMGAIQHVFYVVLDRSKELDLSLRASIEAQIRPRSILTLVGAAVGFLFFAVARRAHAGRLKKAEGNQTPVSGLKAPDMKKLLVGLAGAVAALASLLSVGTLEAWCKNIGTFCSSPPESIDWAKSEVVYVSSGGTECNAHHAPACVQPSAPNKQLQPEMSDFEANERSGAVYLDGEPTNSDPIGTSNVGWFLQPDKVSPDEVCATVFARTSACGTKVFLRGQLVVREIVKQ